MKIFLGESEHRTSKREDLYLSSLLDEDYSHSDIEKIVGVVVRERDTAIHYIVDVLYTFGYEFITKEDIETVSEWLKKHKVL